MKCKAINVRKGDILLFNGEPCYIHKTYTEYGKVPILNDSFSQNASNKSASLIKFDFY